MQGEVTELLARARSGSASAKDRLAEIVYGELHRIAQRVMRNESAGHALQPTALVNDAFIRLVEHNDKTWQNRAHFFAVSAQAMRRILVDHARAERSAKRGGGLRRVEVIETLAAQETRLDDVIAIDEALDKLALLDERQSRVVELRFFSGLTEEEVADVLGVNVRTVKRDWSVARAWLYGEMTGGHDSVAME